jgi:O-antigen/teichoic acid export membrane protein
MLKKAIMVVSGNAFGSLFLLVRNLVVARMMSPENYGIASTFAISMSVVEMLSYLGLNQLMIVDKDGDNPRFQAAMQGFQVLRGCFSATVLFLIAEPYARFLGVERVAWAYQVLALVPFINGFQHYDVHRLRRHMNFRPTVLVNSIPAAVSVLALWPLALFMGDYRIMLGALFFQALAMVAVTHLSAERSYRIRLDPVLMKKAMVFGWPLLLDGALIFAAMNGERLIILREMGVTQFAFFSMAFTLTLTPTSVLSGAAHSMLVPWLASVRNKPDEFQRAALIALEVNLAIAVLLVLGTSLVGGPLASLLLGPKYVPILEILVPIAVLQAIRVSKNGANLVALSIGHTSTSMICNLIRVASLPVSWWVAVYSGDIFMIIWIVCIAEIIAFLLSMHLARSWAGIRILPFLLPVAIVAALLALVLWDNFTHPPQKAFPGHLHWMQIAILGTGLAALASMSGLRARLLDSRRSHG